jgi:cell division protein FtsQ
MPAASLTRRSILSPTRGGNVRKRLPRPKANVYRRTRSLLQDALGAAKKGVRLLLTGVSVLVLVLGMSWSVLAAHRFVTTHPYFGLRHVEVTGNSRISAGQVMEMSSLGLGQNMLTMDMAGIRSALLQNPWVSDASVKRVLPDRLLVGVTEREPSFLTTVDKGLHFAASDGRPIAPVEAGRFVSLPVLSVESGVEPGDVERLARRIEEKRLPFAMAEISWVRVTAGGSALLSLTRSGMLISIEMEDLEENIRKLNLVWRDLESRGGLAGTRKITVFRGKVLAKFRQQEATGAGQAG